MEKRENRVKDLEEKLQREELTPKEAKKILHERGFGECGGKGTWKWNVFGVIVWVAYFILCLLPSWSRQFELDFLEWFVQLPPIHFPAIVIYISIALVAIAIVFIVWMVRSHRKWGGLKESGETVIFYKKGPFRIMRHPSVFAAMTWLALGPIVLSVFVLFTVLSIAAIVMMITLCWYGIYVEEKVNIEKWGSQYQQYMKEVPRFNFIAGLWRLKN